MDAASFQVFTAQFDGQGGILSSGEAASSETPFWIHVDGISQDRLDWVEKEFPDAEDWILKMLFAPETRPRFVPTEKGALVILRGVNLNKDAVAEDMISIRMWIEEDRILTVQKYPLKAVSDLITALQTGSGPKNSGTFLSALSARLFARMNPTLLALEDRVDHLEQQIFDPDIDEIPDDISIIRKKIIAFRRHMFPQKEVIDQLLEAELPWVTEECQHSLMESYHHITRYVENLEAIRDRVQIIKDEIASISAEKLNRNMYILSLLSAIFLPLGFLTGLLGVNIGGIPGVENPSAFWIFCLILWGLLIAQFGLFKVKKWI